MSDSVGGVAEQEPDPVQRAIELADAATPGPWVTERFYWKFKSALMADGWFWGIESVGPELTGYFATVAEEADYPAQQDAEFIAAARSLVPALANELRAVRADLLTTREQIHGMRVVNTDYAAQHARDGVELLRLRAQRDALKAALTESERRIGNLQHDARQDGANVLREAAEYIETAALIVPETDRRHWGMWFAHELLQERADVAAAMEGETK